MEKDTLFATGSYPMPFEFNVEVAKVFDDMVSRSVPLYGETIAILENIVQNIVHRRKVLQPKAGPGVVVDVGCSTGTTLAAIANILPAGWTLIGMDPSGAMLNKAEEKLKSARSRHHVVLEERKVQEGAFPAADLVIMNYTLQFLPVADRQPLLREIHRTLHSGGMLFLSEKVRFPASFRQELVTRLYEDFKRAHGYSESEIARKKEALENILVPLTIAEHEEALLQSGFTHVSMLSLWLNFCTWLAQKEEAH